jgi:hypothetical protein
VYTLRRVMGVETKPRPCVMVEVDLPHTHTAKKMKDKEERQKFW